VRRGYASSSPGVKPLKDMQNSENPNLRFANASLRLHAEAWERYCSSFRSHNDEALAPDLADRNGSNVAPGNASDAHASIKYAELVNNDGRAVPK
jgi:hypothetical protein